MGSSVLQLPGTKFCQRKGCSWKWGWLWRQKTDKETRKPDFQTINRKAGPLESQLSAVAKEAKST